MKQEKSSTKERIMSEALTLFSVKGFEAVSVAEIAEAVRIKAPSLYKHYKSKQDIFEAIIYEMNARYKKQAASLQINGEDAGKDIGLYSNITDEKLIEIGTGLFLYFLHDDYTRKFRKMLTIEQYSNTELAELYVRQYVDEPLAYQSGVFDFLIKAGVLKPENPRVMALHFYSPVNLMVTLCDVHPEREAEALNMIEDNIRQFIRIYGNIKNLGE